MCALRTLQSVARGSIDHRSLHIAEAVATEHGHQVDDRGDGFLRIVSRSLEHVHRRIRPRRQLEIASAECVNDTAVFALGIDDHRIHAGNCSLEHERTDRETLAVAGRCEDGDVRIRMALRVEGRDAHGQARADCRTQPIAAGVGAPGVDPGDARRGRC